jgi:16S rRNA (cytosine1402-N4)-methyltransferase
MSVMADPRPFVHVPVLLDRVLELFAPVPAGTIVDTTLGGAGHATALLDARADLRVLGIDQDPNALAVALARLAPYGPRAEAHHARSDQLATVVATAGAASQPIVGVLMDLGVSSPQFDEADRGFSYRHEAPLDMRMDPTSGRSAHDIVNEDPSADVLACDAGTDSAVNAFPRCAGAASAA